MDNVKHHITLCPLTVSLNKVQSKFCSRKKCEYHVLKYINIWYDNKQQMRNSLDIIDFDKEEGYLWVGPREPLELVVHGQGRDASWRHEVSNHRMGNEWTHAQCGLRCCLDWGRAPTPPPCPPSRPWICPPPVTAGSPNPYGLPISQEQNRTFSSCSWSPQPPRI